MKFFVFALLLLNVNLVKSDCVDINSTSILNIFNKQHESSKGYPEPGRTVGLKITLKQKRK